MPDCMKTPNDAGLRDAVGRAARTKPLLGVCVGEQMLFSQSEEGDTPCLDLFAGQVRRFAGPVYATTGDTMPGSDTAPGGERLKVPHMGWNRVSQARPHAIWEDRKSTRLNSSN